MVLEGFFNTIFGKVIEASPLGGLVLVAFILTLLSSLAYKWLTDQEKMKSLKEELKEHQKMMKESKDNQERLDLQKKAMDKNLQYLTHSFKPLLVTFIPFLIVFNWLRGAYSPLGPLIGPLNWIIVYLVASVLFSIIIRKVLKVH